MHHQILDSLETLDLGRQVQNSGHGMLNKQLQMVLLLGIGGDFQQPTQTLQDGTVYIQQEHKQQHLELSLFQMPHQTQDGCRYA